MRKTRHLRDAYRQSGFVPHATLQCVAFDPFAFGVTLVRRRKKHSAECAVECIEPSTISGRIVPGTLIVPSGESSFSSSFEGSFAGVAKR